MMHKLSVLHKIANEFKSHQVEFALGGSAMLYLKGIVKEFNDLDLIVSPKSVLTVVEIMHRLGKLETIPANPQFSTLYFYKFRVDHVSVDVISELIINHQGKRHYFPFEKIEHSESYSLNGIEIPLQSIQDWKIFYRLMDRLDKIHLIETYLKNQS